MKKLFFSFVVFLFCSCDFLTSEGVEKGVSEAKSEMAFSYKSGINSFDSIYKIAIEHLNNLSDSNKLKDFHTLFSKTLHFADSLKTEMDKLDKSNLENIEVVKRIFLTEGVGDSLYSKLNFSYALADSISLKEARKIEVRNSRSNALFSENVSQWKNQLFGLSSPLATSMILYGFEVELLKTGIESLKEYCPTK